MLPSAPVTPSYRGEPVVPVTPSYGGEPGKQRMVVRPPAGLDPMEDPSLTVPGSVLCPAVPSFPEARCQQAADHAAEEKALQEPDHPGL